MTSLEDDLWAMSQQSRALRELREEIGRVWDDEAARAINGRYLEQHESDDSRMNAALSAQGELLEQAARELESAGDLARRVDECAAAAAEKLRFAEQDMDNARGGYDLCVQYDSDARSKFPLVRELVRDANAACD